MRRPPKPKRSRHGVSPRPAAHFERWIVLIDQAPLRAGIIADCRQLMRALEEARFEMHQFETTSRPAYGRWMASTFGVLLTRRRELGEAIAKADGLIHEVHMVVMLHGGSLRSAYRRLMRDREAREAYVRAESDWEFDFSARSNHHEAPPHDGAPDKAMQRMLFEESLRETVGIDPASLSKAQYEELFQSFCETFFGAGQDEAPEQDEPAPDSHRPRAHVESFTPEPPPPPRSRLKELYRTLVRRLHPDMRADSDPSVSALWHEVQEAYSRGDEERLETLLALCDVEANAITASTSFSQLHAVRADLKRSLNAVRRAVRGARKDPAWKFEEKNVERLAEIVRRDLETHIARLARELAELESMIEEWKRPPKKRAKSPKRKRSHRLTERDLFEI